MTRADEPTLLEFNWGDQNLRWELEPRAGGGTGVGPVVEPQPLVVAARAAFSHSFEVVALISAAIALGTAVMTAVLLRRPDASA